MLLRVGVGVVEREMGGQVLKKERPLLRNQS